MKVQRALVSVSDKTGLDEFVRGLNRLGIEIISTGGTAKRISSLGLPVIEVSDYTGFPEMMDGRVKTLHPKVHAGLLAVRDNDAHVRQLEENEILPIDMVVVNLYPFEETVSREGVTEDEAIENIDIGGPTMLRSASKNFRSVAVVSSPDQYDDVLSELENNDGSIGGDTLKKLAIEVFRKTSEYDSHITEYLSGTVKDRSDEEREFPDNLNIRLRKVSQLRYGENPHQKAAFYSDVPASSLGVAGAVQLQGKELSYNNILDLSAALDIVKDLSSPAVSIVKHNNPCGAAAADTLEKAYLDALDCDRLSAFGSIMGFNRAIDGRTAGTILEEADFVECIIAPGYDEKAIDIFRSKKNLRILRLSGDTANKSVRKNIKKIPGGALVQDEDAAVLNREDLKTVTDNKPSDEMLSSMLFGWNIIRYVKSNAIVLCDGTKTVGIGAGQMSRVDSVIIAIRKAGERAKGSVLISDAFFPKADSIEEAEKAGISAIIQPGGSIRDEEVIEACNKAGIPMVLTGMRHFRH